MALNAIQAGGSSDGLLNELKVFQAGFHDLEREAANVALLQQGYKEVEGRGSQWYYSHSDDKQIAASRDINAQVNNARRSIEQCRQALRENEAGRASAADARERELSGAESDERWADVAHKGKAGCSVSMYFLIAFPVCLALIGYGLSGQAGAPLMLMIGIAGLVFTIVRFVKGNKKRKEKTEGKKAAAQTRAATAQAEYSARMAELSALDAATQAKLTSLDVELRDLAPQAEDLGQKAQARASYLYNADLHSAGVSLSNAVNAFMQRYEYLKRLGTLADENDWAGIDRIVAYVQSGRADTLKEALQLLSQDAFRSELLEQQRAMVGAQQAANSIMAEGFASMLANQEALIEQQQSLFDEQAQLQERQHAQQMAAHASQLALQAEQLNQEARIRANQETAYAAQQEAYSAQQAAFNEQSAFHDEVRSQPFWTDAGR